MVSEGRKYFSSVLKNVGFALLAPCASLVFQWLVFKKDLSNGHFYLTVLLSILGFVTIFLGYLPIKEKTK